MKFIDSVNVWDEHKVWWSEGSSLSSGMGSRYHLFAWNKSKLVQRVASKQMDIRGPTSMATCQGVFASIDKLTERHAEFV